MSQVSTDLHTLGGIVSDLFDGKATLTEAGQRLAALGSVISGQIKTDVGQLATVLGPQATASIKTGLADIEQAASAAVTILDADIAPYVASGAKAAEGAIDTVLDAAIPGGAALNPLVNGGIDALAGALKAAIDARATQWKAQLAANAGAATSAAAKPA